MEASPANKMPCSADLTEQIKDAYIECKQVEIIVELSRHTATILGRVMPTPPGQGFKAIITVKEGGEEVPKG